MKHKIKKNNKGFTLVEVIIAVVVLAIAVVPILNSFVTSAKTQSKAQTKAAVNIISQNIEQCIKAYSMEDMRNLNDSVKTVIGGQEYSYNITEESAQEQMLIKNITTGSAKGYDARVTFSVPAKTAGNGLYQINENEMAKYTTMSGTFAQECSDTQNPDILADNAFKAMPNLVFDRSVTKFRTIEVNVSGVFSTAGVGEKELVKLNVDITYKYNYKQDDLSIFTTDFTYNVFPYGYNVAKGITPSVYIMYYPYYTFDSTVTANPIDTIKINNPSDIPLEIFLVKQAKFEGNTSWLENKIDDLYFEEASYQCEITQTFSSKKNNTTYAATNPIYTNAGMNIGYNGVAGRSKTVSNFKYQVKIGPYAPIVTDVITGNVVASSDDVIIYDVYIEVFKNGSGFKGDPISVYKTTKLA